MTALLFESVGVRFPLYYSVERSFKRRLVAQGGGATRVQALEGVSFGLPKGSCTALLGGNAAGKSTLLRVAAGLLAPASGRVERCGPAFALLGIGFGLDQDFSARQNAIGYGLLAGHDLATSRRLADRAIAEGELGEFADHPLARLGPGHRLRLGLSLARALGAEILVLDEVLEHAGPEVTHQLEDYCKQGPARNGAVLIVERAASLLRRLCDRALVLEEGRLTDQGDVDRVLQRHAGRYTL